jgi:hypothetical protein
MARGSAPPGDGDGESSSTSAEYDPRSNHGKTTAVLFGLSQN